MPELDDIRKEIKTQVSFMVGKFQEFVALFHQVQSDFKSLEGCNQTHDNMLVDHSSKLKVISDKLSFLTSSIDRIAGVVEQRHEDVKKAQSAQNDSLEKCSVHINELNKGIVLFSDKYDKVRLDQVKLSNDLEKHAQELQAKHSNFAQELASLSGQVNSLQSKSQAHIAKEQELVNDVNDLSKDIVKVMDSCGVLHGRVDSKLESLNARIASAEQYCAASKSELIAYVDSKAVQLPDMSKFIVKSDLDAYVHQLNVAAIDAKNASLKASNSDMQIQLLNKQVEQLKLQLKQNELSKA